jgi:hypothetical protein
VNLFIFLKIDEAIDREVKGALIGHTLALLNVRCSFLPPFPPSFLPSFLPSLLLSSNPFFV